MFSINKYTRNAYATRLVILLSDVALAVIAIVLACFLRFNFEFDQTWNNLTLFAWIFILVRIVCFRWFKTYAVIVRYAGASDVVHVAGAIGAGTLLLFGLSVVLKPFSILIPKSIVLIEFFLLLSMLSAYRLLMPALFYLLFSNRKERENVIILGAGQLGAITRNIIRQDAKTPYNIIAIFDDNLDIINKYLDGVPVYHTNKLSAVVQEEGARTAIFAIKDISLNRKTEMVDLCLNEGMKVLEVPYQHNWKEGNIDVHQLREIRIDDLLERSLIMLQKEQAEAEYTGKRVMITGGAGSIGSELVRQMVQFSPQHIYVVDQAETPVVNLELEIREEYGFERVTPIVADVSDGQRMESVFVDCEPQIVFHAAAYKHVPIMETYPREALKVNVLGTKILADLANKNNVERFVMVSTDKAVNPTNVMGASKRIAEMYVQSIDGSSNTNYITTRFGNVLGSNGSVVPRFKKQIAKGGPITVTHPNITRYFMTIPEASQLVIEAGAMGRGGEVYLFDMGESVKISDLAERMIRLSGLVPNVDIEIKYTGLRPGEKLYEELLTTKENSIETHHPKITIAKTEQFDKKRVSTQLELLNEILDQEDDMKLVKIMKELVPEFKSNNSRFDKLDVEKAEDNKVRSIGQIKAG